MFDSYCKLFHIDATINFKNNRTDFFLEDLLDISNVAFGNIFQILRINPLMKKRNLIKQKFNEL